MSCEIIQSVAFNDYVNLQHGIVIVLKKNHYFEDTERHEIFYALNHKP